MPDSKDKIQTYNHDVAGLCTRIHRFCVELKKSVSSGTGQVNQLFESCSRISRLDYRSATVGFARNSSKIIRHCAAS